MMKYFYVIFVIKKIIAIVINLIKAFFIDPKVDKLFTLNKNHEKGIFHLQLYVF